MPRIKPLTPKQEDRRHRILSAARDMVADHGYDGMVMSQVADRAGVSPTTLYNLYNTKDELVLEALRELLVQTAREVLAGSDGPGWPLLIKTIRNGASMANSEPAYAEAIVHALLRASSGDALVEMLLEGNRRDIHSSIKAMASRDELRSGINTEELATSMLSAYWGAFLLWNKGLIRLQDLEHALAMDSVSLLIPAAQGEAKKELEALLVSLD